jgi:sugar phosphate isomerase/epimerase
MRAAAVLADVAPAAAELGVKISVEIHQHCLADNSASGRSLMERVGHPVVGLNPDLGNVYWNYHTPEEASEAAITAMAPRSYYWHMKNLVRVHVPQHEHSIFLQVPLPDGDIDYRFAVSAMLAAGYQGDLAIEGLRLGDQLRGDGRSLAYVRELLKELAA